MVSMGGHRGSRGAAEPAPEAPAGVWPAGANEGRGDPEPRPERRKGEAHDPAVVRARTTQNPSFVGLGGANPARRPP